MSGPWSGYQKNFLYIIGLLCLAGTIQNILYFRQSCESATSSHTDTTSSSFSRNNKPLSSAFEPPVETSEANRDDNDLPYPRFVVILKSSRVGSTFLKNVLKDDFSSSFRFHWEKDVASARRLFERCGKLPAHETGIGGNNGKWACTAHLNDRFRAKQHFQDVADLIRDYNASVVIQIRANAVEKGISMSKIWGKMKTLVANNNATETIIAKDIFDRGQHALKITRSMVHAAYHNFIPLPSPTQQKPLWIWFEDLNRNCTGKFAELFEEIGMSHLPPPPSCEKIHFPEGKQPYGPITAEILSKEPLFVPMIDFDKFNREVDTDEYRRQFEKETEFDGVLYGPAR